MWNLRRLNIEACYSTFFKNIFRSASWPYELESFGTLFSFYQAFGKRHFMKLIYFRMCFNDVRNVCIHCHKGVCLNFWTKNYVLSCVYLGSFMWFKSTRWSSLIMMEETYFHATNLSTRASILSISTSLRHLIWIISTSCFINLVPNNR